MNVLHVRNAYKLGGAELYYVSLISELESQGVHGVMVTQQPELTSKLEKLGVVVERVPWIENSAGRRYLWQGPRTVLRYMYLIAKHRVDILNLSGRDAQVYGTFAAKIMGRKAVWTDHGDLKDVLKFTLKWQRRLLNLAIRLSDRVIFVSNTELKIAARSLPALKAKSIVIYNGVKTDVFKRERKSSAELVVFSNARIQIEKGFADLVEAMELVRAAFPKAKLVVGAGVEDDELLENAKRRLGAGFEYAGFLTPDQISAHLSSCTVYAFASHSEAFPLSVLEAKVAGAPIVATTVGGIPEQIETGRTGLLVPPKDPQSLGEAMKSLLSDKVQRETLGRQARREAMEKSDLHLIVKNQIIKLYNSI